MFHLFHTVGSLSKAREETVAASDMNKCRIQVSCLITARVWLSARHTSQGETSVDEDLRSVILQERRLSIAQLLGDTMTFFILGPAAITHLLGLLNK